MDFNGKVVIITGGAGMLGSAMGKKFAELGAKVVIADCNKEAMEATVAAIKAAGGEATAVACDVADMESTKNMVAETVAAYGRVDVLINNAGINGGPETRKPIHEYDDDLWNAIINVDMNSVFYCSKPAAQQMVKQGEGGCIINVSAVVGLVPSRNQCAFMAAKAGVFNLTKAMALELAPENIRVNAIAPGMLLDELARAELLSDEAKAAAATSHVAQRKPGEAQDIVGAATYLASDDAKYVTGSILTVDGGWNCGFARNF